MAEERNKLTIPDLAAKKQVGELQKLEKALDAGADS